MTMLSLSLSLFVFPSQYAVYRWRDRRQKESAGEIWKEEMENDASRIRVKIFLQGERKSDDLLGGVWDCPSLNHFQWSVHAVV